jgi:tRNA(Arg) A34 adenosine deaminase TadA
MMALALDQARAAAERGEVPVGAVIYRADGTVLAQAGNRVVEKADPTAHAELEALRAACAAVGKPRLDGCHMAVTLEPCAMCAQAISLARMQELRFGAHDVKSGGTLNGARVYDSAACHHKPVVIDGQQAEAASALLKAFFAARR